MITDIAEFRAKRDGNRLQEAVYLGDIDFEQVAEKLIEIELLFLESKHRGVNNDE